MPGPYRVTPDRDFLHRVVSEGGGDLKNCFQCATCSVVCELSESDRPFPRKEMIWTQWGLKDRLMADPDVWLCHQCNDCSIHCPRGARPGDVLAAIRRESILHYAVPGFVAKWINEPKNLPLVLAIPAVLLVLALLFKSVVGGAHEASGQWQYADLFPHWLLIVFFSFFSGLAVVAAVVGVMRFWAAMKAADVGNTGATPSGTLTTSIIEVAKQVFLHEKFARCTAQRSRYLAHLGVFYGFVGLLVVTVWAVLVMFVLRPLAPTLFAYPFSFWNPMKMLANLSTLALIGGCVLMIRDRMAWGEAGGATTRFDWAFLWLLLSVAVTGLTVEVLRYADVKILGYPVYFAHLVLVFSLLVYLPYSKFGHAVYRFVALVYAEHTGRNRTVATTVGSEATVTP